MKIIKIIEYENKYLEDVKDLLVELEEYIVSIDKDNLDRVHEEYREKMAVLDLEEVKNKLTDYFYPYDYIVGDWAYGKIRLKGFYDEKNKNCKEINNIKNVDNYIKNNCAYNCKHFIVKKCVQK